MGTGQEIGSFQDVTSKGDEEYLCQAFYGKGREQRKQLSWQNWKKAAQITNAIMRKYFDSVPLDFREAIRTCEVVQKEKEKHRVLAK